MLVTQNEATSSAKNCITVGAVGNTKPNDGWAYKPTSQQSSGIADIAEFSSRGPTLATLDKDKKIVPDRIKPDVVAPGVAILSAASRALKLDSEIRTKYGKSEDLDWMYGSGTSMATPLVAGCVAILREVLVENDQLNPSAALVKAILINGAIKSPNPANPIFDYQQGFGRVDVNRSIAIIKEGTYIDSGNPLSKTSPPKLRVAPEEERTWQSPSIIIPKGASLTVTLTYPDPHGALLQNDLNLIVQSGGIERHGNMPDNDSGFDTTNNVEQVVWKDVPGPTAKIIVRAHAFLLPTDAQSFAMAWSINSDSE